MIGEKIKNSTENVKGGIKKMGKRNIAICTSVLVIALAVCLNWALYAGANKGNGNLETGGEQTDGDTQTGETDNNDTISEYFASVQLTRQQARDEALEVLRLVIDSESAEANAKEEAIADVSRIADEIASEANIESIIKGKGFADCVAVISEGKATVIVKTDSTLMQNEVAQIQEIVYEQANISPENIKITEKY